MYNTNTLNDIITFRFFSIANIRHGIFKMIQQIINIMITILIGPTLLFELFESTELIGWTLDELEKPKQHRQTYLEYVKERLEVERLMS